VRAECQVRVGVNYMGFIYRPCCCPRQGSCMARKDDTSRLCGRPSVNYYVCGTCEVRIDMCAWHWDSFQLCKSPNFDEALFDEFYPARRK
jgi:hypothetical protein